MTENAQSNTFRASAAEHLSPAPDLWPIPWICSRVLFVAGHLFVKDHGQLIFVVATMATECAMVG